MELSSIKKVLMGVSLLALTGGAALAQTESAAVAHKALTGTYLNFIQARKAMAAGKPVAASSVRRTVSSSGETQVLSTIDAAASPAGLTYWTFNARSSRDGLKYQGAMVGTSPFNNPQSTSVPAKIIPMIFRFAALASAIDPNTGAITTVPGNYTSNPVARDNACLSAPNNVPATVLRQSPLFNAYNFSYGGTSLGTTQYIDAFQRANFYNASSGVPGSYHLLFSPVNQVEAVEIEVPADEGVAIDTATFFGPPSCGTLGFLNIDWFDAYLNTRLLPALAREAGVTPATLPVFLMYNTVMGGTPAIGLGDCCIGGYHSYGGFPTPTQTYSVADFDTTNLFGTAFPNTAVIAHELGEWANDPYGINLVPAWGGTGQVSGCQNNLEVGDPLTGTQVPTVLGKNGFTYNLQELVFYSWFLGAPSIGINGWFSLNGTFATDAGTPCAIQ
jgi:hypothetical protein